MDGAIESELPNINRSGISFEIKHLEGACKGSCTVHMNTSSKRQVDLRIILSISPITTYISSPDFSSCSMYVSDNSYVDEAFKSLNIGDLRSTFVIELVQGRGTQNDVTIARLGQTLDPSPRDTFEAKKRVFQRGKKAF